MSLVRLQKDPETNQTQITFDIQHIRRFLQALLPKYWISVDKTCKKWDKELNGYLDDQTSTFEIVSKHQAIINKKIMIWTDNYPYGYGNKCNGLSLRDVLPKNSTRIRLYERLKNAPRYNPENSPKFF